MTNERVRQGNVCPRCKGFKAVGANHCRNCMDRGSKPVSIMGVEYPSVNAAVKARPDGKTRSTILYRVNSKVGFKNWFFVEANEYEYRK